MELKLLKLIIQMLQLICPSPTRSKHTHEESVRKDLSNKGAWSKYILACHIKTSRPQSTRVGTSSTTKSSANDRKVSFDVKEEKA